MRFRQSGVWYLRRAVIVALFPASLGCTPRDRDFSGAEPDDLGTSTSTPSDTSPSGEGTPNLVSPSDGQASGAGGSQNPSAVNPTPEAEPPPAAAEPEPNGGEPETDVEEPEPQPPASQEPEPETAEPEPSAGEPEPGADEPAPDEPAPDEPEPGADEPEPSAGEPEPSAGEPEPAVEAEPSPDGETEPIGGCDQQLLADGHFDLQTSNWSTMSTFPGIEVVVRFDNSDLEPTGVSPRSMNYLAWLGGIPDNQFEKHYVTLQQNVALPTDVSQLTFSGYVWIQTEETEPGVAYDATFVDLTSLDGNVLWHPHAFSNLEASTSWEYFEYSLDTVSFGAREVILEIRSETDPMLVTSFWFDDLRLVARCGR